MRWPVASLNQNQKSSGQVAVASPEHHQAAHVSGLACFAATFVSELQVKPAGHEAGSSCIVTGKDGEPVQ